MNSKAFNWQEPPILMPHSRSKLKILGEYSHDYLLIRCSNPRYRKFRVAIVDGFSGGGYYKCGSLGSPLVLLKSFANALKEANIVRKTKGITTPLQLECLFIFNDKSPVAINSLKEMYKLELQKIECENFFAEAKFFTSEFEEIYPLIKKIILDSKFVNVLFNLDQCGTTAVKMETLCDINNSFKSPEVFLTFMISALERFIRKSDQNFNAKILNSYGLSHSDVKSILNGVRDIDMLARVENLLLDKFRSVAQFISPFAIKNPNGYSYWLVHLSKQPIARVAHNNVLHNNATHNIHFGKPGIRCDMLNFDPRDENKLYLFRELDSQASREELVYEIPKRIEKFESPQKVGELLKQVYNETPAQKDDILWALYHSPDIEVKTPANSNRRAHNTIKESDYYVRKSQKSIHVLNSKMFIPND